MKNLVKRATRKFFNRQFVSCDELDFYRDFSPVTRIYSRLDETKRLAIKPYINFSRAQFAQDLFAIAYTKGAKNQFFVEFGATDGVELSNTWLLEKKLEWSGILAEPAKIWHEKLKSQRACNIEHRCVSNKSGEILRFYEVPDSPVLSSLEATANNGDWASNYRLENHLEYTVETISLDDLLDYYNAPGTIQFLSMDTEGGEFKILDSHQFTSRKIECICIEHNYNDIERNKIFRCLDEQGYKRVHTDISLCDDWYVLENI